MNERVFRSAHTVATASSCSSSSHSSCDTYAICSSLPSATLSSESRSIADLEIRVGAATERRPVERVEERLGDVGSLDPDDLTRLEVE